MERYCASDAAAFRALYALTAPRLLAYLMCLIRDRPSAEELLQLTFIKLHRARASYIRGADPIPWLYTIAHRTCLDEHRRARRAREKLARCDVDEALATIDGRPDGGELGYDERTLDAVLDGVAKLPESQRLAVVLTKLQGKSMAEAAAILGTTPGAVKVRAHRGYVTLRAILRGPREET